MAKKKQVSVEKPELAAEVEAVSLAAWLTQLRKNVKAAAAAGEPAGACLLTDPHTGTQSCVLVDAKTCKALRGTFVGGPCGG